VRLLTAHLKGNTPSIFSPYQKMLLIIYTTMTSTDSQLNALKSPTPDQTLLSFTPRQPKPNASIVHTQTIRHIVAHHGSAPINHCEGSTMPPPSKAQNSNKYRNQLISPPSWAGSRGVQHVMQFLSRRE
jgi:hypothetical protein